MPTEFLPPDPYAEPPAPAKRPTSGRPEAAGEEAPAWRPFSPPHATGGFAPPTAGTGGFAPPSPGTVGAKGSSGRATAALALGAAGLGVLVFTIGALFILTLPASIAGWIMGRQARNDPAGRDQANIAVTIGIVGTVLGVIAAIVWILIAALDWPDNDDLGSGGRGESPTFDVIRATGAAR